MPTPPTRPPLCRTTLSWVTGGTALIAPLAQAAPGDAIGAPITVASGVLATGLTRAGNGAIVATYLRGNTLNARRFAADGTPQGASIAIGPAGQVIGGGDVASDADGDFVVAWVDQAAESQRVNIRAQRYAAGGQPLGAEIAVVSVDTRDITVGQGPFLQIRRGLTDLRVDMNADGDFAVLWGEFAVTEVGNNAACKYLFGSICVDQGEESLRLRRFDANGSAVGQTSLVTRVDSRELILAGLGGFSNERQLVGSDVAMRDDDTAVVAWIRDLSIGPRDRSRLYTRQYSRGRLPTAAREIGTGSDLFRSDVRIAAAADSSLALVHRTVRNDLDTLTLECTVQLDLVAADGSPIAARQRVNAPRTDRICASLPTVSMSATGHHVVAWNEAGLQARRYATGGVALAGSFVLTPPGTSLASGAVFIDSDAAGNFVAGYSSTGDRYELRLFEGP